MADMHERKKSSEADLNLTKVSLDSKQPHKLQPRSFVDDQIEHDIDTQKYSRPICTSFPAEANGALHIGHAITFLRNESFAKRHGGIFNWRFDDTNPYYEKQEYADMALEDIEWLGVKITGQLFFSSDYFDSYMTYAEKFIRDGYAYVCDLNPEEVKEYRGGYHRPGKPCAGRSRTVAENLALFDMMREGRFKPGEKCLRIKGDLNHPNMSMRDPVMYRIADVPHHRYGNKWHVYPTYDFAHVLADNLSGVTHSICTLEFHDRRLLYDWLAEKLEIAEPSQQMEFSKVKLKGILGRSILYPLLEKGIIKDWDDPRLLTLRGLRRRGFPPEAIREFCADISISCANANIEVDKKKLENTVRKHLNLISPRRMVVENPITLTLDNIPPNGIPVSLLENPEFPELGTRELLIDRELFVTKSDFAENPSSGKFRGLTPGGKVLLRGGLVIECTGFKVDEETKEVSEILAVCDLDSLEESIADRCRKAKGTIHWVSKTTAIDIDIRLIEELFDQDGELNSNSFVVKKAKAEHSLEDAKVGEVFQFERMGYFCVDPDSSSEKLLFNSTVEFKGRRKAKA